MSSRFIKLRLRNPSELSPIEQRLRTNTCQHMQLLPVEVLPDPLPTPGANATISPGGVHPSQPSITDFHFEKIRGGEPLIVGRFDIEEVLKDPGPKGLMEDRRKSSNPDIRWIHLPFNSMKYTEKLMEKVCQDLGLPREVATEQIFDKDKWEDRLHAVSGESWHHSTYMESSCSEINIGRELLSNIPEGEHKKYQHPGANMVMFMPFLHWGTEDVLKWRNGIIAAIKERREQNGVCNPLVSAENETEMRDFYVKMLREQLFSDHPLHLRRSLDQFYYTHAASTEKRDGDQVVSRHGPDKRGKRVILIVDQLWLWILGGNTLITCFDRRWEEDNNPQTNVFDNVLWKLQRGGQAKRVRSAYELAHMIMDEASSFFFTYSRSRPKNLYFHELFRKAICTVNDTQTEYFEEMVDLNNKPPGQLLASQQNHLFDVHREFKLVREVRDIKDELNMIHHVYSEQVELLDPLYDLQTKDAWFRLGLIDSDGNFLNHLRNGGNNHHQNGGTESNNHAHNGDDGEGHSISEWDERDWFKRTSRYMNAHREAIRAMLVEAEAVYNELCDTITLKQNNANIFEAHESRNEAEAVMAFTLVSSFMLPLSFFTSIFSMNVHEISEGSRVSLGEAMAYTIPLSLLITLLFGIFAFNRQVREYFFRQKEIGRGNGIHATSTGNPGRRLLLRHRHDDQPRGYQNV